MPRPAALLASALWLALILLAVPFGRALAGSLDRAGIEALYPAPLVVGEKDERIPVWPILKQEVGRYDLVAYVFESIDLAPIPGFGGTPVNLLVEMTPEGTYRGVRVLAQHEPVFLDGLGEEPLRRFVEQYADKSLKRPIRVGGGASVDAAADVIDGVSKATASVKIVNETVLASALAVARAKLGFGEGHDPNLRVTPRADVFTPLDFPDLLRRGLVGHRRLGNTEVEAAFAGSPGEGTDPEATSDPSGSLAEIYAAYLNVPIVGRNLLGPDAHERLMRDLEPGHHALLVLSTGRWSVLDEDFVRGAVPTRIALVQGGLPIEVRDLAIERGPTANGAPEGPFTILRVAAETGFDPSREWTLEMRVTRERGQIYPERVARVFTLSQTMDADLFVRRQARPPSVWAETWRSRAGDLAAIALALGILVPVLARERILVRRPRAFAAFRWAYLAFTLLFVGWYAQAQLSVVTLTGLVRAATVTHDLSFLLYDPPSLLLWGFVLVSLVIWGRGTFCGWLCPFGALQEFVAALGRKLRLRQVSVPPAVDRTLRKVKYVVLAALLASAALAPGLADGAAEVEPFKTAITLGFWRSWPFVLYGAGLLALNLFVHKAFCRYLCPLGAALALGGRLRALDWIPRRSECGTPCQLCRVRCRYGAIAPSGRIDYDECFQCMECVVIYHDRKQCVPLILDGKRVAASARRPAAAREVAP